MKYLFTAILNDGTTFQQTQEDKSTHTEGRNAFYDVKQRMDEVRAFGFVNTENGDEYMIDMHDQHFEVNGVPFFLHSSPIKNPRLVYFLRNRIDFASHDRSVTFNFGFQANDEQDNNHQFIITLS